MLMIERIPDRRGLTKVRATTSGWIHLVKTAAGEGFVVGDVKAKVANERRTMIVRRMLSEI